MSGRKAKLLRAIVYRGGGRSIVTQDVLALAVLNGHLPMPTQKQAQRAARLAIQKHHAAQKAKP